MRDRFHEVDALGQDLDGRIEVKGNLLLCLLFSPGKEKYGDTNVSSPASRDICSGSGIWLQCSSVQTIAFAMETFLISG